MADRYIDLCERVWAHCRERNWYGPDDDTLEHRGYWDAAGQLHVQEITHDFRAGFEFPAATDGQLRATEQALGISLPPMLRTLHSRVANGGFGPRGGGMTGVCGGHYYGDDGRYQTMDQCTDTDPEVHYFDLGRYEAANGWPRSIVLPPRVWPAHFLHFYYWGCGLDTYLDGVTERVYLTDGLSRTDASWLFCQEDSLEDWLATWLAFTPTRRHLVPPQWFDTGVVPVHYWAPD